MALHTAPARNATARPAAKLPEKIHLKDAETIIARMVDEMADDPSLVGADASITRDWFLDRGWSRHQIASYGPRAVERFKQRG